LSATAGFLPSLARRIANVSIVRGCGARATGAFLVFSTMGHRMIYPPSILRHDRTRLSHARSSRNIWDRTIFLGTKLPNHPSYK
jgi:hypothetical protein